jgi:hypothetical protein
VGSNMRPGCDFRHFSLSDLTIYPVTIAVLPNIRVCWSVDAVPLVE